MSHMYDTEKKDFEKKLSKFASELSGAISKGDEWTIKGFIDIFKNIYTISADTKIVSKILELHLFPLFLKFADDIGFRIELAEYQNWYPDMTFISKKNEDIKFAVDIKTTYRVEGNPKECNGFTLGSHGTYFTERDKAKNIQYPYNQYSGHFCLGIIYSRTPLEADEELKKYSIDDLENIPSVINHFTFFAVEKWKIASDRSGSGNTANIGSVTLIDDLIHGNGVFAKTNEETFDDYWINYNKIQIPQADGTVKKMTKFEQYLSYRQMDTTLNNKHTKSHKKGKK